MPFSYIKYYIKYYLILSQNRKISDAIMILFYSFFELSVKFCEPLVGILFILTCTMLSICGVAVSKKFYKLYLIHL